MTTTEGILVEVLNTTKSGLEIESAKVFTGGEGYDEYAREKLQEVEPGLSEDEVEAYIEDGYYESRGKVFYITCLNIVS